VTVHSKLYIPARTAELPFTVDVTPESAGWTESSLQVVELDDSQSLESNTGDTEVMILPLVDGGVVECDGVTYELSPRASAAPAPNGRSPTAAWLPRTCPSSCGVQATAAVRCTTSAPQASSRPIR
jgi:5-deoxy-D-glucuronate isomerase